MSYILEALKKAQAERQLGSAPTIHDLSIQAAPQERARAMSVPLWAVVSGGALLAAGAAFMWWRQSASAPAPAPVMAMAPVVQPAVVPPPAAPSVAPVPAPAPVPVAAAQAPVRAPDVAPPTQHIAAAPVPKPVTQPKPAAPVAAPAPEESLPTLRELPPSVQQGLPQVAFGGYMYSPNPADRLLLIDKALRHEGEEVAPGLILEKLLPKSAVLNFRGTRYRVPY
jgi:general secretion pathway protein B